MTPSAQARERRRAPRIPSSGSIQLFFDDPVPAMVEAHLVEVSSTGFRVSHNSKLLDPGMEVRYEREGMNGRARIVWTHILKDSRLSGFLIL